jgi:asparagine synthase (glutamine-hydrolysing)
MCGICGIIRFDGGPIEHRALDQSCNALRHRGPDHTGTWLDTARHPSVGFGAVRLTVLDPSPAGHQPMHDPGDRFHLVYNGEIYNFRDVRTKLEALGHAFRTEGDTEVVLRACMEWGVDAPRRFNGMWALAFFDASARSGFLSRDPFGIKPLVYAADHKALLFASELRGLRCLDRFDDTVDSYALVHLLRYGYIADPATIHRGARRLSPGHVLEFDAGGAKPPRRLFDPLHNNTRDTSSIHGFQNRCGTGSRPVGISETRTGSPLADYATARQSLRRSIERAVVRQRVSDVPIGAFLSGGLDSSIVVAHLSAVVSKPITTFCVGYTGAGTYDETAFARRIARYFDTDHHELHLTDRDVLDAIPRVLDHLAEPFGDSSIIPTSLIAEFAHRHVVVALSGDGGDELFGGYWRYLGHDALKLYNRIPSPIRRALVEPALRRLASSKGTRLANRVRQIRKLIRATAQREGEAPAEPQAEYLARHLAWSRILAPEAEALFHDQRVIRECDERVLAEAERVTASMPAGDPLNRILAFDLSYQLPADMLQKVDLAGMMHSLEVRVPLLDHDVVDLVAPLPSTFKVYRGLRRRILTDAYRGRLPDDVFDRSKQGFEVPIGEYFRGPLRDMFHSVVTREAIESFELLSYSAVETIYQDHLARRGEHADLLFALLSVCWWKGAR